MSDLDKFLYEIDSLFSLLYGKSHKLLQRKLRGVIFIVHLLHHVLNSYNLRWCLTPTPTPKLHWSARVEILLVNLCRDLVGK